MAEFILKQYREALADLNRAIQYNKNSANFFNMRGIILNAMEEYDAAIGDFDTALKLDKNYVNAYHNRGYAYQRKRFNRRSELGSLRNLFQWAILERILDQDDFLSLSENWVGNSGFWNLHPPGGLGPIINPLVGTNSSLLNFSPATAYKI